MPRQRTRYSVLPVGGPSLILLLGLALLVAACTRSTPERGPTPTVQPAVTATEGAPEPTPVPATPTAAAPAATPVPSTAEPTAPPAEATATPVEPVPSPTPILYENPTGAFTALASYFNAVNRKEYRRAYAYWETPGSTYEDFAAGYADTAAVLLVISPPTRVGAAAGSMYVGIPALLLATHSDGSAHNYAGCYVMRSADPALTGAPSRVWSIYNAVVNATPGNGSEVTLLADACAALIPAQDELPYEDRNTDVGVLASLFNAVNLKDYARAYGYWDTPPAASLEQFAQGYAGTANVLLAVSPPRSIAGGAGSMYTSIPTLLLATHVDGSRHVFLGCYVARRRNQAMASPPDPGWSLHSATVDPVAGEQMDASLLAGACAQQ